LIYLDLLTQESVVACDPRFSGLRACDQLMLEPQSMLGARTEHGISR